MYEYSAKVVYVVDGDTVDLAVDLGFNVQITERFRLYGINTPELHAKDPLDRATAVLAKAELETSLRNHTLNIKTYKDGQDKYGRYLVTINVDGVNINDKLVKLGLAKVYLP